MIRCSGGEVGQSAVSQLVHMPIISHLGVGVAGMGFIGQDDGHAHPLEPLAVEPAEVGSIDD